MNSREKGKRGERAWRDELRANGYDARRGQQFSGSPNSPDVICDALPDFHFEVKCVERLNLHAAMQQALRDCATKIPVVAHKRNYAPWLVTTPEDSLGRFVGDIEFIRAFPDWLHVLFKRTQRLDLVSACALARSASSGRPWMILHQRIGEPCLATMPSEVFFQFLRGDLPPDSANAHVAPGCEPTTTNQNKSNENPIQ